MLFVSGGIFHCSVSLRGSIYPVFPMFQVVYFTALIPYVILFILFSLCFRWYISQLCFPMWFYLSCFPYVSGGIFHSSVSLRGSIYPVFPMFQVVYFTALFPYVVLFILFSLCFRWYILLLCFPMSFYLSCFPYVSGGIFHSSVSLCGSIYPVFPMFQVVYFTALFPYVILFILFSLCFRWYISQLCFPMWFYLSCFSVVSP